MKSVLAIVALVAAVAASPRQETLSGDGTCTAQLNYCGKVLINSRGWTEGELKDQVPDHKNDVRNWLFHCKDYNNHIKAKEYCHFGCKDNGSDESDECYSAYDVFDTEATKNGIHIEIDI